MSGWRTALFAFALAGCASRDPLYIGHLAARTGPNAAVGEQQIRGVQLAVEEANADPKSHIGERRYAVIHTDTAGNDDTATSQAIRLATVNRVRGLILPPSPTVAEAVAPLLPGYGLVAVTPANMVATNTHLVPLGVTPEQRAVVLKNRPHEQTVTRFWLDNSEAAQAFAKKYRDLFHAEPTVDALAAYDSARFLMLSMTASKSTVPDKLREYWAKHPELTLTNGPASLDVNGVSGTVFLIDGSASGGNLVEKLEPKAKP